uniref:Uncharacterized protein n=1 Tax=Oryza sativa subsp. japonica TaxID=39947 RepID=Q6EU42_ORYSJ|nr:hypothetical protein [Oryza sativa Japonica Group]
MKIRSKRNSRWKSFRKYSKDRLKSESAETRIGRVRVGQGSEEEPRPLRSYDEKEEPAAHSACPLARSSSASVAGRCRPHLTAATLLHHLRLRLRANVHAVRAVLADHPSPRRPRRPPAPTARGPVLAVRAVRKRE